MDIEQRKERWRNLYRPGSGKFVFLIPYFEHPVEAPLFWPDRMQERVDYGVRLYEAQLERARWLDDDFIPCLFPATGTEIYAEALGSSVYRPRNNMPFARHCVENASQAARLKVPDPSRTRLMDLVELGRRIREKAGADAPMKLVDVQSPMDILAQIWDKTDLFASMMDEDCEELILELSGKICGFLIRFWDIWFEEFGTSYISHCPDYYMEGGITLSADEIGNVSPALYGKYFHEELNRISRHFGGIGIHCCADSRHQWAGLKRVEGLRMLNLCRELPVLQEGYRYFTHCAHAPLYLLNGVAQTMPDMFPSDFPTGTRAVIVQRAASRREAVEKAERLREACRMEDIGL